MLSKRIILDVSQYLLLSHNSKNNKIGVQEQTCWPKEKNTEITQALLPPDFQQNIHWTKDVLLRKWCWGNWICICRRLKLLPCFSPCTKIEYTWTKDLYRRLKTLKLLGENFGGRLEATGMDKDVLNGTPIAQEIIERINKWDYLKLKRFYAANGTTNSVAREPQSRRKWLVVTLLVYTWLLSFTSCVFFPSRITVLYDLDFGSLRPLLSWVLFHLYDSYLLLSGSQFPVSPFFTGLIDWRF